MQKRKRQHRHRDACNSTILRRCSNRRRKLGDSPHLCECGQRVDTLHRLETSQSKKIVVFVYTPYRVSRKIASPLKHALAIFVLQTADAPC